MIIIFLKNLNPFSYNHQFTFLNIFLNFLIIFLIVLMQEHNFILLDFDRLQIHLFFLLIDLLKLFFIFLELRFECL